MLVDKNGNEVTINDVRGKELDFDTAVKEQAAIIAELESKDCFDKDLIEKSETAAFEFYACGVKGKPNVKAILDAMYSYIRKYPTEPCYEHILSAYVQLNFAYDDVIHADICTAAYEELIEAINKKQVVLHDLFLFTLNEMSNVFILDDLNNDDNWFDYIYRKFQEGALAAYPDFLKSYLKLIQLYYTENNEFSAYDYEWYQENFREKEICEMAKAIYTEEEYNIYSSLLKSGYERGAEILKKKSDSKN